MSQAKKVKRLCISANCNRIMLQQLTVNEHIVPFVIDSDASVNLVDKAGYSKLQCKLSQTTLKIYEYGASKPLNV